MTRTRDDTADRLVDLAQDMLAVITLDTARWVRVNPAAADVLGWPEDALRAMAFLDLVHPDDRDRTHAAMADLTRGTAPVAIDHRLHRPHATDCRIAWRIVPDPAAGLMYCVGQDLSRQDAAEAALRDSEDRLRTLANAVPQLVWSARGDGTVDFYSERCGEYAGIARRPDGSWEWAPVVHADELEATIAAWTTAVGTGRPYEIEHRIAMRDGAFRWHLSRAVPVHDAAGRVVRWYGSATDIHTLKSTERRLQDSEGRLRATFAGVADAIISLNAAGDVLDLNEAFASLHGFAGPAACQRSLRFFVDTFLTCRPDGGEVLAEDLPFSRAARGETVRDMEMEVRRRATGDFLFIGSYNAVPVRDADGAIDQVVVTIRDITERRRAEDSQRLLAREVDHRARNALAVVQAVLNLTRGTSVEAFAAAVRGRVQSIARCHTRLSRGGWRSVPLSDLLLDELAAYGDADGDHIVTNGPPVQVAAAAVQPLTMVLHELTTNAVKHGALATAGGHLAVTWTRRDDGGLDLSWRESGLALPGAPGHAGTGTSVMAGSARQMGGRLDRAWPASGLACRLVLPAETVEDDGAAEAPATPAPAPRRAVTGERVLVVEDEALLGLELVDCLRGGGYAPVGPVANLDEAMRLAATEPDLAAAVLDVNLGGRPSWTVGAILGDRGVPHLFATGYAEEAMAQAKGAPVVQKPFAPSAVLDALSSLIP